MEVLLKLTKRNITLYLRNKTTVFFSFLSVIILAFLFIFVIGQMFINGLKESIGDIIGIAPLSISWLVAGLLTLNSINIPIVLLGQKVNDTETKTFKDFLASPIKRSDIAYSYILSAFVVGFISTLFIYIFGQTYILAIGGEMLSLLLLVKMIFVSIIALLVNSAIIFYIMTFLKSESAVGAVIGVTSALFGFITGTYMPMGNMGSGMQIVMKLFPQTHLAALYRLILSESYLNKVFGAFPKEALTEYTKSMGTILYVNGTEVSFWMAVGYAMVFGVLFMTFSVMKMKKQD